MSAFEIFLIVQAVGAVICFRYAYRWCIKCYDYGIQNPTYNGTGALGFAVVWELFLLGYLIHRIVRAVKAAKASAKTA